MEVSDDITIKLSKEQANHLLDYLNDNYNHIWGEVSCSDSDAEEFLGELRNELFKMLFFGPPKKLVHQLDQTKEKQ